MCNTNNSYNLYEIHSLENDIVSQLIDDVSMSRNGSNLLESAFEYSESQTNLRQFTLEGKKMKFRSRVRSEVSS